MNKLADDGFIGSGPHFEDGDDAAVLGLRDPRSEWRTRVLAHEGGQVPWTRYRSALRATVAASAAPYGYTLTIWTSGAVLSHAHGIPSTRSALLFLIGAVAAFALIGGFVFGGLSEQLVPEPARAVAWGGLHFLSVGAAIVVASLVAHFVTDIAAWLLGGFLVTGIYLLGSAAQLAVVYAARR